MEQKYLLGFDVGTYESKGVICDFNGRIIAKAASPHNLKSPAPGFAEHDPIGDWWVDFKKVIASLLEQANISSKEIAAVGVSTIMAAITPVDEHCNPLRNAILYGIDTRCVSQAKELNEKIGAERLKNAGGPCGVEHFGPKILWIKENEPEIFDKAKHFTIASGFITARLTGEFYVDKYSVKSAVPMINPKTLTWNDEMCELVCPKEKLPQVADSTYFVIGHVTAAAAAETGLAEGTAVICGTTDAGAEAVSVGVVEPGDTMLMYGSTSFFASVTDVLREDTGWWSGPYTLDGLYAYTGGMATTGSLTRWILDNMAADLVEKQGNGELNAYDTLFAEAEDIPLGSDGLICLPYFLGERMPHKDPAARGVLFGLNLRHKRGNVVRAAFEGIGYGIDQNFDLMRKAGLPIHTVTAVGGGTKTPLWMQIVSDICNIKQIIPEVTVGASYGDALMAGLGIGVISSPTEIKKMVKIKYVTKPDPERHAQYAPYKEIYKELYQRNKDLMHKLK
ncbi:MAG: FGGY-family carbohydrate kinase [Dysosmobacter sp.]|nr:FGGY-family carbohydrate kinase [Dysosmobacter sp.]